MKFYRYKVTMQAAWNRSQLQYSKGRVRRYPFRWMALFRGWLWLTLNLFPGELRAPVERLP